VLLLLVASVRHSHSGIACQGRATFRKQILLYVAAVSPKVTSEPGNVTERVTQNPQQARKVCPACNVQACLSPQDGGMWQELM
jgi:hypothetical protein